MGIYQITGVDRKTGASRTLTIEGVDEADARQDAENQGVIISEVKTLAADEEQMTAEISGITMDFVEVYRAGALDEADIILGCLATAEIPAIVTVPIVVEKSRAAEAREIIKRAAQAIREKAARQNEERKQSEREHRQRLAAKPAAENEEDEPILCLECGKEIQRGQNKCSACGWSYEGDQ